MGSARARLPASPSRPARPARARRAMQRLGVDPRYLRRLRWIAKARSVHSVGAPLLANLAFVLADPEPANFTYELANENELQAWVAEVTGAPATAVADAFGEVRDDAELARRLRAGVSGHWWWTKPSPPFGKRAAWYAYVRLLQPAVVVETGVHDGLGSLLLLRALERNAERGGAGRLISFDVNPAAGWLVGAHPLWELRIEPARPGLATLLAELGRVDVFLHDSLHTYDNERFEQETAAGHLAPGGVLLTDNAHGTRALADVASARGLRYAEVAERSAGHFYAGGTLGAARRPPDG
jgi:Methyltransferase domain